MTAKRRTNLLAGVVALAAAVFVLLNALGAIPPGIADAVVRASPAVLVMAGIAILLQDRVRFSGVIALVIALALAGGVAAVAFSSRQNELRDDTRQPISQLIPADITLLRVNASVLSTDVDVFSSADPATGVSGEFLGAIDNRIDVTFVAESDNSGTLTLTEIQANSFPLLTSVGRSTLALNLPQGIPLDFQLTALNGDAVLNMNTLSLERVNVDSQAGDLVITLPDYTPTLVAPGEVNGTIAAMNGAITLFIPPTVSARLELNRDGSGIEPQYDAARYNYLVGDVLEARDIGSAQAVVRYIVTAPRGQIRIETTGG
jgi:multidrug transporter EmrE-like cation transporter